MLLYVFEVSQDLYIIFTKLVIQSIQTADCNGVPSGDSRCCSSSTPCGLGGGDCDNDLECLGPLVCGSDNCKSAFSSASTNWPTSYDCCIGTQYFGINSIRRHHYVTYLFYFIQQYLYIFRAFKHNPAAFGDNCCKYTDHLGR